MKHYRIIDKDGKVVVNDDAKIVFDKIWLNDAKKDQCVHEVGIRHTQVIF